MVGMLMVLYNTISLFVQRRRGGHGCRREGGSRRFSLAPIGYFERII
jgi:hypothetical protein